MFVGDVVAVLTGSDDCHVCVPYDCIIYGRIFMDVLGREWKRREWERKRMRVESVTRVRRGD